MKAKRIDTSTRADTPMDYLRRAKGSPHGLRPNTVVERAAAMGRAAAGRSKAKLSKDAINKLTKMLDKA